MMQNELEPNFPPKRNQVVTIMHGTKSPDEHETDQIPREKLSLEMIFRKSIADNFKEYVRHSSLGGVKQVFDKKSNIWERLVWTAVFFAGVSTISIYLQFVWVDMLNRPLIVSMESKTYPISKIDFPAIGVCNVNRISVKALDQWILEEFPSAVNNTYRLAQLRHVWLLWGRLHDYSYVSTRSNRLYEYMTEKLRLNTYEIVNIMRRLSPRCEDMLVRCAWGGKIVDCMSIFSLRRTSHGFCCTFNYVLAYGTPGSPTKPAEEVKKQTETGHAYGLNLILDPLIHDYGYLLSASLGFDILMFPAYHYADKTSGRVTFHRAQPNTTIYLEIKAVVQKASPEVRKYSIKTRGCLFPDEEVGVFGNLYSYSACIVLCRLRTIKSLCKCTPFLMASDKEGHDDGPVCSIEDLKCLNKYREKLLYLYPFDTEDLEGLEKEVQDSLFCPECYADCELTQYFTKSFETPSMSEPVDNHIKDFSNSFVSDIDMTNKTFVGVYFPVHDAILNRLDVVFYWFEILSNIGGFAGIIMGFSFISIIEIVYFSTIRFSQIFYYNLRKYY